MSEQLTDTARVHRLATIVRELETEVMSTGSTSAASKLNEARKQLDEAVNATGITNVGLNYNTVSTNVAPAELTAQLGVVDTSGTSGAPDSSNMLRVGNVFGHDLQQEVAKTASISAPDPNTVVVTLAQSPDTAREDILKAAGIVPEE